MSPNLKVCVKTLPIMRSEDGFLLSQHCSGVDDVFVFISTFRQASHLRQLQHRIIYTIKTAGRATFLTSFTTAAAYAANTFSQVSRGELSWRGLRLIVAS